jgi:hypothetical protein
LSVRWCARPRALRAIVSWEHDAAELEIQPKTRCLGDKAVPSIFSEGDEIGASMPRCRNPRNFSLFQSGDAPLETSFVKKLLATYLICASKTEKTVTATPVPSYPPSGAIRAILSQKVATPILISVPVRPTKVRPPVQLTQPRRSGRNIPTSGPGRGSFSPSRMAGASARRGGRPALPAPSMAPPAGRAPPVVAGGGRAWLRSSLS